MNTPAPAPAPAPELVRCDLGLEFDPCVWSCNLHKDCDEADRRARERGRYWATHCRKDDCEDCFGS